MKRLKRKEEEWMGKSWVQNQTFRPSMNVPGVARLHETEENEVQRTKVRHDEQRDVNEGGKRRYERTADPFWVSAAQ